MADKKPSPSINYERTRPVRTRARSSVYETLVTDFMASGKPEGVIEGVPTKLASQYMGLRNAVKSLGLEEKVLVTRYTKAEEVWLVRRDM